MATRGRFSRKKIFCLKSILGHSGPKKNFFFNLKIFRQKIFFLCIRHFSDVFGPRAKAICTSALKLSTMENMLIMMNFNDFRPDRKFKMATRGHNKILINKLENFPAIPSIFCDNRKLKKFITFIIEHRKIESKFKEIL